MAEKKGGPRMHLAIGTSGNAGNFAAINVPVETTEWTVGARSLVGVNEALAARGHLAEMPVTDYGYVRGSLLLHERMDCDLCND